MNSVILSMCRYPDGDAEAVRVHSLAKILYALKIEVTVIARGQTTSFAEKKYDNITFLSMRHSNQSRIVKIIEWLFLSQSIKKKLRKKRFDIIVVEDLPFYTLNMVKRYAKNNGCKLVHDSVEWYSKEQFWLKQFDLSYLLKNWLNKKWVDKSIRIIAISSYLEKHFLTVGCQVARIPVVLDTEKVICQKKKMYNNKLILVYAGSPGRKDYLNVMLDALSSMTIKELDRLEFRILGVSKEQIINNYLLSVDKMKKIEKSLKIYGRVERKEVFKQLVDADFTVLMRSETQIYAKAGFPTKVVESLAASTPVICNKTSDLSMYVVDRKNGLLVDECSPEAFLKTVRKGMLLTTQEKKKMYQNARDTAVEFFDYHSYLEKIKELLQ